MSSSPTPRRLFAAVLGLFAGLVLAGTASAFAATLSVEGGVLRYIASPGTVSNVDFDQTDTNEVTVRRNDGGGGGGGPRGFFGGGEPDNDPITPGPGCEESNPPNDGTEFVCTGVTSVFAEAGDSTTRSTRAV